MSTPRPSPRKLLIAARRQTAELENYDYEAYFTQLLKLNVDHITVYYLLGIRQATRSFLLTIGAALAGFSVLLGGILMSFFRGEEAIATLDAVTIASGLLIEFISGVMFYLYNKTAARLDAFYPELLRVQDIFLGLKLTQSITNDDAKDGNLQYLAKWIVTSNGEEAPRRKPRGEATAGPVRAADGGSGSSADAGLTRTS